MQNISQLKSFYTRIVYCNLHEKMEKNEGSPDKSPSEQDLRRERPPPPSSEGGEMENLPVGGQGSQPQVGDPPAPRSAPRRFRLVAGSDSSGKVVVREPYTGNTCSGSIQWPAELSASWTIAVPQNKRKGQFGEVPMRVPRCVTCGKIYRSWKALFGHLRAHPEREYRGAFPPPKASNDDPLITNLRNGFKGLTLHHQRELTLSLINAANVVSAVLDPAPANSGEGSGGTGASSGGGEPVPELNTPDENPGSLRNNRVELDLNAPPQPDSDSDSDSDDGMVILTE